MRALFLQVLLTARRDRLFVSLLLALAAIALLGSFLGAQSLVERAESAVTFAAFAARLAIVLGMALFATVSLRRGFDSGEMLVHLSRPLSRGGFVLATFAAYLAIATALAVFAGALLWLFCLPDARGLALWSLGVAAEAGLALAFALFAALGLESVVGAFTLTAAFYLLARLSGVLTGIAASPFRDRPTAFDALLDRAAHMAGFALPRLDRLSGAWLVHPQIHAALGLPLAQIAAYAALLLGCAAFDLERRRL